MGASADLAEAKHGMGIRFAHLTDAQARLVAEFSEEAMKKAIGESPDAPTDES